MAEVILSSAGSSLESADKLAALVFRVGRRVLAIPAEDVMQVRPLAGGERWALGGGGPAEVDFNGVPVPFYPLWEPLKEAMAYQEFADLMVALKQRKQDHISWMANLADTLLEGAPFTKARSPYECAFGKWYYGYQPQNRRLRLILREFEAPHRRIHNLADRLIEMAAHGQGEEAVKIFRQEESTTLVALIELFDHTLDLLGKLQQYLAVIVHKQRFHYALGVDAVVGLFELQQGGFSPLESNLSAYRLPIFGFMKQADGGMVPLLDWQRLIAA